MIAILSGLLAGAVHVWSGPDHLTAIAPLAVHQTRRAWLPGLRWGIGHSSGVALIGVLSLILRDVLPVDLLSFWSERLVGVLLIGIGLWALNKALRHSLHSHPHQHAGEHHVHLHLHAATSPHPAQTSHRHTHAAFGIGILHGLAGSSHLLGILPMLAFPTRTQALCYLGAFAAGTVMSMTGFSWTMGFAAQHTTAGNLSFYRPLMICCGLAAMVVGVLQIART